MLSGIVKRLAVSGVVAGLMLSFAACGQLDVIGNGSVTSFDAVLNLIPNQVEADEINAGWSLTAPDGSARFIWSGDWSRSPLHDVMLELDATPFIEAGLDPEKLPDDYAYYDDMLTVGVKLGDNALNYNGTSTPLAAYEQIVKTKRDRIGYHMDHDIYELVIYDGNAFRWAKDMSTNNRDIVFVLNSEPLIAAGVDPESVEGWVFTKVEAMDETGKMVEADKFLKRFDLK